MAGLDWRALETGAARPQTRSDHIALTQVLEPSCGRRAGRARVSRRSAAPGPFPSPTPRPARALGGLIDDLLSDRFPPPDGGRCFGVDLAGRPAQVTLRGQCSLRDGSIPHRLPHEGPGRLLLYLNPDWESADGNLRLLRSGRRSLGGGGCRDPRDHGFRLVVFRRTDDSWHGPHALRAGPRRVLQLNYLHSGARLGRRRLATPALSALTKQRVA